MKQMYLIFYTVLGLFLSFGSIHAQGFEPKEEMKVDRLRSTNVYRRNVKIADLFTYPAEIDIKSNISENSEINISFSSSNESNLFFDGYYYSQYSGTFFYYNVPASVYGTDTLTLNIEYNGINTEALLIVNSNPIQCKDDFYTMGIGETLEEDLAKNDVPKAFIDYSTFEIIESPTLGEVEIVEDGKIKYTNNSSTPNYSKDKFAYRIADTDANYDTATVSIDIHKSSYATKVFEFLPAPGQFVNTSWANAEAGKNVLGNTSKGVSLGGFGGYIVVGFEQPIVNRSDNPYGVDFTVVGNAFSGWGEPAAVMVMKDENGNGLPDDTWYELAGSEYHFSSSIKELTMTYYNPKYDERYTIPYSTDKGFNGAMRTNSFHKQSYYPDPIDFGISPDSVSYTGTLTKFLLDKSKPNYITSRRLPLFGYADVHAKNPTPTKPRNPYFEDENGKVADGFDLSWAVDANGNHIELDEVHFVKIYSTVQEDGGWLGEVSPEIFSVAITTPDPNYISQDYEANAIGVPQLQVLKGETLQYEGVLFKNGIPQSVTPAWSSTNTDVATVNNNGLFTAIENGDTYLRFTGKEGVALDSVLISVVELTDVVISAETTNDTLKIIKGETSYIHAEAIDNRTEPSNRFVYETYRWTSSDQAVGTISNGLFLAKNTGITTVVAQSTYNTALSDTIIVEVNDAPALKLKNDVVKIAYNERQGTWNIADLFENDNKATMYFKEVADNSFITGAIKDLKTVEYTVQPNVFGLKEVSFDVELYSNIQSITVVFDIEDPVCDKNVLFVNGGQFMDLNHPTQLKSYLPATNTTETIDDYIAGATSVQDMVVDGNFAFVSADYYVTRYNIAKGIATDSIYTQDLSSAESDGNGAEGAGVNNKMALYKNMLLVSRQFSSAAPEDGYNVRVYNKGDLSLIKKIPVSDQATDVVVVSDTAYVMLNGGFAGTTSSLAVIDLKTLTLNREIMLGADGTAGLGVMQMQVKGQDIYFVRLPDFQNRFNSGVLVFNTLTGAITEHEYDANTSYDSSPLSIEPMTGDTLFVKKDLGYVAFNTATATFGADIHFPIPARMGQTSEYGAKGSVYDPETKKYYVAYNYWHGVNGAGQIYDSNLDSIGYFEGVGPSPELMKVCNVYSQNATPVESNPVELAFKDVLSFDVTLPADIFTDSEDGIVDFYMYNPTLLPEGFTYDDETRRFTGKIDGPINGKETFSVDMQGIDRFGDFALTTIKVVFFSDNPPVIANPISDVVVDEDADDTIISLENLADDEDGDPITYLISKNTNNEIVTATIVGTELTLNYIANAHGVAEIEIEVQADGKSVYDSFTVTINSVDDAPIVANPISNISVLENAEPSTISLAKVFTDIDSDDAAITKTVKSNSNTGLVTASILGDELTLTYTANASGEAVIEIEANSNGKTVTNAFSVIVDKDGALIVANPIADVMVKENAAPSTISLINIFSKPDDKAITKTVKSNSNADLVNASILGNELTLIYTANTSGEAEIVVEANSNGKTVTDTFTVTVLEDQVPVVANPLTNIEVRESAEPSTISLVGVFTDADDDDTAITKTVKSNSNADLVNASILGNELTLTYTAKANGVAEIVVEATSNGKTVTNAFTVTVLHDQAPVVANPIADLEVRENAASSTISLAKVFTDADDDDTAITTTVKSNSNADLVNASILGDELTLTYTANASGEAVIVIEANSNGKTVTNAFTVTVTPASGAEILSATNAVLYPNPSNGVFRVKTSSVENIVISIFNVNGVLIYRNEHYCNDGIIDISNQPKGIYFVKVNSAQLNFTKSIIVK